MKPTLFAPEAWLLNMRIRFTPILLIACLTLSPIVLAPRATAGMFGISIPANYGQWFTQIYELYLENQDLIANARKLYTAYMAVSNTIDALEGLGVADKAAFTDRWRRNMRVMLETQIWFELDQLLFNGRASVNQLIQDVLGLAVDQNGNASINPELIQLLAIDLAGDPSEWEGYLLNGRRPRLPNWFVTKQEFDFTADFMFERMEERAFRRFDQALQEAVTFRIMQEVAANPLAYLLCNNQDPCYSPFNLPNQSQTITWTWDEVLRHMYDRNAPIHQVSPLPGEITTSEGFSIVAFDRYLHRRVSSAVWRAMGREFKEKLRRAHLSFARRCHEIDVAVQDIENLVTFLEDVVTPLDDWQPDRAGSSIAILIATSFSLTAGGWADEQAKAESFIHGRIRQKIDAALNRARQVKAKLRATNDIFQSIQDQITAAERPHNRLFSSFLSLRFAETGAAMRPSSTPPHAPLGATGAFQTLAERIRNELGNKP